MYAHLQALWQFDWTGRYTEVILSFDSLRQPDALTHIPGSESSPHCLLLTSSMLEQHSPGLAPIATPQAVPP